jgi:ATP-dependent DNA helicase RecG
MSAERTPIVVASPDDLDAAALDAFVARRAPSYLASAAAEDVAVRLGLLARMGTRVHPTPVGLIAFGRAPQIYHPEWGLSAVRVRGGSMADPVAASHDLEGPLPTLVERAMAFVREQTGVTDDDPTAQEYPLHAVREALVNALVHRDLRKPARAMLRLLDGRLEVWSPGGFPEGLGDPDDALEGGGISVPRNPLLASVARGLGLGEQIGRGFVSIRRALAEGTRDPSHRLEIQASPAGVLVRMPSRWRAERDVVPS